MKDDLKTKWKTTSKQNGRQPQNKIEDDLKRKENERQPTKRKWKTNQSTKINLIGCDTIVNSPSIFNLGGHTKVGFLEKQNLHFFINLLYVLFQHRNLIYRAVVSNETGMLYLGLFDNILFSVLINLKFEIKLDFPLVIPCGFMRILVLHSRGTTQK